MLAQSGANVVLVDADLRKPGLHRLFAIDGSNGLTNNLAGDPMELTIQRITDQLWVIVGGPVPPNPSELLSGRRMEAFSDELSRRFDYVIFDSAPILAVSDATALSRHVDGVLLVAQAKRVSLPHMRESLTPPRARWCATARHRSESRKGRYQGRAANTSTRNPAAGSNVGGSRV